MTKYYGVYQLLFLFLIGSIMSCSSCSKKNDDEPQYEKEIGQTVDGVRIAWDYKSLQRIAPQEGRSLNWAGYPRVHKLKDGTVWVTYETQGNIEYVKSDDDCKSWSEPVILFEKQQQFNGSGQATFVNMSNGELIELSDGTILTACNYRPVDGGIVPFAIAIKRSVDKGVSWSDAEVIYEAGTDFNNGCWEPAFLQVPSGEVQVYFANEGLFTQSEEQNISMLKSLDSGISWSTEITEVCFRAHHRDGMPVPILLNDEIVVAIEDNVSGQFKPYTVRTSVIDAWNIPILAQSDNRNSALIEEYPDATYAGAPYLIAGLDGVSFLSYQTTYKRNSNWELSTMEVAISDENAKGFTKQTRPFDVPITKEAKWNALGMLDENTVVALSSTNFSSQNCGVWLIKGYIIPELSLQTTSINVDGSIEAEDWGELPLFVGHTSANQVKAGVKHDGENLYFAAKLLLDEATDIQQSEVSITLDPFDNWDSEDASILYKYVLTPTGKAVAYMRTGADWKETETSARWVVKQDEGNCFSFELKIPFDQLEWEKAETFRVNVGLGYPDKSDNKIYEWIANSTAQNPRSWCRVSAR
ncbi:exo-alpha-sialidase [Plebeiibacterium sediminum]|uniref:Exo-alpha-sialidase n=1 Tax=Plebeiibacterium sediminum TaxID=2992112 RepID=A0AAE3M6H8_9BACT|nr:exo-alpha-sialidase [Plebeiobacterium sediminum]MCW3788029.1 exo-alpha-sialidase [Plebeiobacterium sediminum]